MKTKKRSTLIIVVSFCALIAASVVIFPYIIAASPPNREIETVLAEELFPTVDDEASGDAEFMADAESAADAQPAEESEPEHADNEAVSIDINAISENMAYKIAENAILYQHHLILDSRQQEPALALCLAGIHPNGIDSSFRSARYVESIPYIDAPVWQVLFYLKAWGDWQTGVYVDFILEHVTLDEYVDLVNGFCERCSGFSWSDKYDDGIARISKSYIYESLVLIEVDAFTGEIVGMGELILSNHHGCIGDGDHVHKAGSTFSYDDAYDWELLSKAAAPTGITTLYWRYFDLPWYEQEFGLTLQSGSIPTPEPKPTFTPEPNPIPIPTPEPMPNRP